MSVDIDWQTLTSGPDGLALAEAIRAFVHERFQQVPFPRLIRSVKCHGFEFGTVAPQIVLKDICDPLPDFYENGDDDEDGSEDLRDDATPAVHSGKPSIPPYDPTRRPRDVPQSRRPSKFGSVDLSSAQEPSRVPKAPGLLGGTSNLGYFHLPLSAGFSGTATPLAAVAGAQFSGHPHPPPPSIPQHHHHHSESFSSISPPSSPAPASRPHSREDSSYFDHRRSSAAISDNSGIHTPPEGVQHEPSPDDMQVVFHATYSGDVKLSLTADVFLDYPMPSFVGIPLKLNITGLTFDGVGLLAYIKKQAHLCFLAPEDAEALVGGEANLESPGSTRDLSGTNSGKAPRIGALLEDIKIESEMGETDTGRQVLKNVGKIEKFVLEQVQRIFEEEFVYPSFWTFLV